ncbi:MurR/RpiR family transcriptional regulator [Desulfitibacter alkalitolerans]|uniref:MurR/RpiR family transcriptional regulator n=1 Tax=Desulfitibacter alkalitolerans TaxID=264641 RepID=UPI00068636B6|nr:MurR/RpiR family transcriptional regulator [Desulfitibacter alkalitolerans]
MIEGELKQKIKNQFHKMSIAHKMLAEYLLENYEKAAFLTAARLGAIVGTSESTVIRFASTLGYHGYPELQEAMQEMVRRKLSTATRLREISDSARSSPVLPEIFIGDMQNLKKTFQNISAEIFEEAVKEINNASTIYILGLRSAHCLALFLGFYLEMIGKNVKVVPSGVSSIYEQLSEVKENDLLIGISFPRYTRQTIEGVEHAKKLGAKVVAITDTVVSPLAHWADITLTSESNIGSFIESFAAPLSLINAIVTAAGQKQIEKTLSVLEKREETWGKYRIFYFAEKGSLEKNSKRKN